MCNHEGIPRIHVHDHRIPFAINFWVVALFSTNPLNYQILSKEALLFINHGGVIDEKHIFALLNLQLIFEIDNYLQKGLILKDF